MRVCIVLLQSLLFSSCCIFTAKRLCLYCCTKNSYVLGIPKSGKPALLTHPARGAVESHRQGKASARTIKTNSTYWTLSNWLSIPIEPYNINLYLLNRLKLVICSVCITLVYFLYWFLIVCRPIWQYNCLVNFHPISWS